VKSELEPKFQFFSFNSVIYEMTRDPALPNADACGQRFKKSGAREACLKKSNAIVALGVRGG
jgi:hypothetical protein